jgi:gamma-glutamylcyclotransferase (GGCT)/AIG2-like uncharacterized protein YtfP
MHLFFYGVLLEGLGDWPFLNGIGPGRAATTRGRLFAIQDDSGWYPALVPGEGVVHGAVHAAGGADIAAMDDFEGTDYDRREIDVYLGSDAARGLHPSARILPGDHPGGRVEGAGGQAAAINLRAHAYCFNAALTAQAEPIVHGDFARWLIETGRHPITER